MPPVKTKPLYPSLVPFVVLILFLNVLLAVVVITTVRQQSSYVRHFRVDESMFVDAVHSSVTNFLSNYSPFPVGVVDSVVSVASTLPSVVVLDDLGFASSPLRGDYFVLDGCRYRTGDYCPHGLVLAVLSDRAFCQASTNVVILRGRGLANSNNWIDRVASDDPRRPQKAGAGDRDVDAFN